MVSRFASAAVEFDAELVARYDVAGPRYTSYPTAPNFRGDFREEQYLDCLRASNEDPIPRPLSLYVHVPFCESPCFYCGCTRIITRDRDKALHYLSYLEREIAMLGARIDPDRVALQLHLGGGTPNYLDAGQLAALVGTLAAGFRLDESEERDYSIEIDPRFASPALFGTLAALGFNRVSFGVQDFDPAVQQAVNRIQPLAQTRDIIEAARDHGMRSINLDLIYGLPKQTPDGFARTLETVVALRPDRIALYGYAHLPERFKAQRQIVVRDLPERAAKLALLGQAIAAFGAAGYRYIGMDHFALPQDPLARAQDAGTLQRNFQGYSTFGGCDLVGLGMSSISHVGDCYAQNARFLPGYYHALENGKLPIARGLLLNDEDVLRAELIQSLMCQGAIDIAAIERRFGIRFAGHFASELERLRALADDGLVEIAEDAITVTARGRLLLRAVAMCFDECLEQPSTPAATYSRVI